MNIPLPILGLNKLVLNECKLFVLVAVAAVVVVVVELLVEFVLVVAAAVVALLQFVLLTLET
jgi:hypothetical protein